MFKGKTKRFLQMISVLLTFAIFTGTFTAAAEAVQNENTNHVWLITDNLTETPYSDNIFNRYEDKNFETNTAEIFTYNESGEVDYTYSLSGSVGDATASLDLNFWHNTNDLGNAPYDSAVAEGSETFLTETDGTNFMNSVYGFGIGWSLDIPQIEYINSSTAYFHNGEGKAYRIGAVAPETTENTEETESTAETTYKLCGFPYDYTIEKNIVFENEEDTEGTLQGFIGTDRYGNRDYFNRDGRFIKSQDRNGNVIKTVTYDNDRLISSIIENDYTLRFIRTQTTDSIKISIYMSDGEQEKEIGILTTQNQKLSSALVNRNDESSYTTNNDVIIATSTNESRETVSFEYSEIRFAVLTDSETNEVASDICGYNGLLLINVTVNSIDRTEYSYTVVDSENTEAVQLAELYNSTYVAYNSETTANYALSHRKEYKSLGSQSSQRNSVIANIESTSTDIVNPGYDPANPNNTEETETNPVTDITTETTVTDFVYSGGRATGCYTNTEPVDSQDAITSSAVIYDYTIDETTKAETQQRVGETISFMVSHYTADAAKENSNSEWVLDEETIALQNRTGKNISGEIVYNRYSDENISFYKYNSNGSPIVEDVADGLKYIYTYDEHQELTKTEFDIYTINYSDNGIESIYVNDTNLVSYDYLVDELNSETYANNQSLWYNYDSNGNVMEVFTDYKSDENKLFSYTYSDITENGGKEPQLLTVTDYKNNLKTEYVYDELENSETVTSVVFDISGENPTELYRYTTGKDGAVLAFGGLTLTNTFTSEKTYVSNEVDEREELSEINTSYITVAETILYNVNTNNTEGTCSNTEVKNGNATLVNTEYGYDDNGRLTSETTNGTTCIYTYDDSENMTSISNGTSIVEYVYDEKNQLIRANDQFNNITYVYEYDNRGNILSKKEYPYTTAEDLTLLTPAKADNYTYNSNEGINWQDELATFNGNALTYDAVGNLTSYNGYTYTWVNGRQLSEITNNINTYSYTYDYNGIRTSKTVNGSATNYITNNGRILAEYTDSYSIKYWYDEVGNPVGFIYKNKTLENSQEQMYIYTRNIQGDITGILDSTGTLVTQYAYDAWGNITNISGTLATTIGVLNGLRYRGYYYDTETGYYYLQSRYYNPEFSRFINSDCFITSIVLLEAVNGYAYCANSPVSNVDSAGYWKTNINSYYEKKISTFEAVGKILPQSQKWSYEYFKRKCSINKRIEETKKFNKYIYGQFACDYADLSVGNWILGENGCGIIAIYNCMKKLNKKQNLSQIIGEFEINNGLLLGGRWGVNPYSIKSYFKAHNVACRKYTEYSKFKAALKKHKIGIMCTYNIESLIDIKRIEDINIQSLQEKGVYFHYFAIFYKESNGYYYAYNFNIEDKKIRRFKKLGETVEGNNNLLCAYVIGDELK